MFSEHDDEDDDVEIVRSFMLTKGRTRATVSEIAIETLIVATDDCRTRADELSPEQHQIAGLLSSTLSVAEVSAHLGIPLRAAVILTSEMLASGFLEAGITVESTTVDTDFLYTIRNALQML